MKSTSLNQVTVESIKYEIEEQEEKVFVDLNRFSIPTVFNIEGIKPRIVIDIMNVASWNDDPPFRSTED